MQSNSTSKYLQLESVNLHYLDYGGPGAQTLVLVHGGGANAHCWLFRYVMSASIHGHFRLILHESSSYSRGWKHTYPVLQGKKGVSAAVALRQHLS
jgi:4,5:9,10-diseco-3-hydroxy-5,9,17-trioxoandrosta-1(10),2-diene-4-oate hydrolase